jgi:AAA family ATP:ADP antiporter
MASKAQNSSPSDLSSISNSPSKFHKLLDYLWPVERHELPKFLFLTLLMFCILGIQNLIRAMKDSVVNTMIGTETIVFLKFWGVMPAAFLVTIIYVKLVSVMKGENIFYLIMSIFLGFFVLFAFVLFPNYQYLHLDPVYAANLSVLYPNLKWFILLLSNWSFSLFYIIAELWPSAIFALLFWQFVNKITTVDESKRFYPLFGLLGQTGIYLSGQFLMNLGKMNEYIINNFALTYDQTVVSIQIVISVVLVLGVIALVTFWVINHKILDIATTENLQFRVKKNQISLKESFKMVVESRYIRLITLLLFCYGVSINLVESPWKSEATKIYPNTTDFAVFVGSYLSYTGILTILFVIIGSNIVRKLGWLSAAIITPFMVLITGMLFFMVSNFKPVAGFMMIFFVLTDPIMIAIIIGTIQNVLSKSTKYTLFDSTKEMSYVPLDEELKTRGKAAADMIGTKLGKSSSAFLQSMLFVIIPTATYQSLSSFLMIIFFIICIVWIWAVVELNKEYKNLCKNKNEESVF